MTLKYTFIENKNVVLMMMRIMCISYEAAYV